MKSVDDKKKTAAQSDGAAVAETKAALVAAASLRETRQIRGKSLRKQCPRSSHADVILGQGERDALALIEDTDKDRLASLLPLRFTRMAESPFAFFRGT